MPGYKKTNRGGPSGLCLSLMSGLPKKEECVRVVVRCRPMSSKEQADGRQKVVDMDKKRGTVVLAVPCLAVAIEGTHMRARAAAGGP